MKKKGIFLAGAAAILGASYELFCPKATYLGRVITTGDRSSRAVALVFDKTPNIYTQQICNNLHTLEVPATFFIVGEWARDNASMIRALRPFEIGVQAEVYTPLIFKATATIRALIRPCVDLATKIQDRRPAFLLPPHGWKGPALLCAAARFGLQVINPSYKARLNHGKEAISYLDRVIQRARAGDIILVSICEELKVHEISAMLSHIVEGLRAKGLTPWGLRALVK